MALLGMFGKREQPSHMGFNFNLTTENSSAVYRIIEAGTELSVPMLSFFLMGRRKEIDEPLLKEFMRNLQEWPFLKEKRLKITFIGQWYDLPQEILDIMKKIISDTRENEGGFVNLFILYDGQQEIVDACKIIAKKIQSEKETPENITKETIKEALYGSFIVPPEVMVIFGRPVLNSFLLWDSAYSFLVLEDKDFNNYKKSDLQKVISQWRESLPK